MAPLFSVIIPVYNGELYIDQAISSALCQQGVTFEVIVINDGSTDNTYEILRKYDNVIKIIDQNNMGISEARNMGVKIASGKYIALLDADDIWLSNKLRVQSQKISEGYEIVYCNRYNIGHIGDLPEIQSDVTIMKEGDIWEDLLLLGNMITTSSAVINKELFIKMGGFNEVMRYCEDWDLWLRCAERDLIGYCSEPLVKYRFHENSLSKNSVYMSKMREVVIANALASDRGSKLSIWKRRKVISYTWATSGWESARAKNVKRSLRNYILSLYYWPFNIRIWYDIARVVARRA